METRKFLNACLGVGILFSTVCSGTSADPLQATGTKATTHSPKITVIRLWNNAPAERIILRADGTASYFGLDLLDKPGVGEYRGTFPPEEFRRLENAFTTQGFFSLKEQYPVPYTVGFALYSIVIVADNQPEKLVLVGSGHVPAALNQLKSEIRETASKAAWQEGPSGLRGVLVLPNAEPVPENSTVTLSSSDGLFGPCDIAFSVDKAGRFDMPLPPGTYRLRPDLPALAKPGYFTYWGSLTVTVLPDKFTELKLICKPEFIPLRYQG